MKKELRDKWCEALRSGEYEQGKGYLCSAESKFCCLGVLMDIGIVGDWKLATDGLKWVMGHDYGLPSGSLLDVLGLSPGDAIDLASMNDTGKDFATIAEWIERYVPVDEAA